MTQRPKRNFRSIVIEPFKQIRIGIYVILLSLLFVILATFLIGKSFYEQYQHVMSIFEVVDPEAQWEVLSNEVVARNAMLLVGVMVLYLLSLFYLVFQMTHRIYGPLVSVERFIRELKKGNYSSRIMIRKKDDLQDLTQELNSLAEHLEKNYKKNQ